jgi:ornithine cyclodeaminase/alanine dehydrogenase-like protein (mu-crystallin family)
VGYLLLHPEELRGLVDMADAINVIEKAYRDVSAFPVVNVPRQRVHSPDNVRVSTFSGGAPSLGVIGVAEHAERIAHSAGAQSTGAREHQVWVLHDSESSQLLAIMIGAINERTIGWEKLTAQAGGSTTQTSLRTGATSGVGFKYLVRQDARTAGLIGSGNQAITQIQALKAVRPIERVKVYSPTRANREQFAARIGPLLELAMEPVASAEEAVRGVDVVVAATNSNVPVFDGAWLEPGQHVVTIVGSNAALLQGGWLSKPRREIDNETVARADVIVANSRASVMQDKQGDLYEPIEASIITPEDIGDLADLVAGKIAGRTSPQQITLHKNNNGLGCAEMALAKLAYEKAVAAGRGRRMELPVVQAG